MRLYGPVRGQKRAPEIRKSLALFDLFGVGIALEKILPSVCEDRAERIVHADIEIKAFQQE